MAHDQVLEMLEIFGEQVIPEYDTDRTHSTDHYRSLAEKRFPPFQHSLPEDLGVSVIPSSALLPLG
jgi:hypothetical protein